MNRDKAIALLADTAKAIQKTTGLKRETSHYAAVCMSWAPRWAKDRSPLYAAGVLSGIQGLDGMLPDIFKMDPALKGALWMLKELLEAEGDAPGDQIEQAVAEMKAIDETAHAVPAEKTQAVLSAIEVAQSYGQTDGAHHKMWVIDQMLRNLLGSDYPAWVADYEKIEPNGDEYEWDIGIAP